MGLPERGTRRVRAPCDRARTSAHCRGAPRRQRRPHRAAGHAALRDRLEHVRQEHAPVCAASFAMPVVELYTSIRVEDSLEQGMSYFMAALARLKQIVDTAL